MDAARELDTTARFLSGESRVLPGVRRVVPVTTPAAGSDWSIAVPGGVQWRLIGAQATFTTSAVVASRFVGLNIAIQGVIIWTNSFNSGIPANTTRTVVYQPGTALSPSGTQFALFPIPFNQCWLGPGDTIGSQTANTSAGDAYTNINAVFEELYVTNNQLSTLAEGRYETELAIEAAALQAAGTSSRRGG